MKRVINFRNTTMAIATAVLLGFTATEANATEDPKTTAMELRFLGNFRSKPVFEVSFNNKEAASDYVLNIRDEFGNSLYREQIGNSINKKFMLNTDEVEDDILTVEITSRKDNKKFVYEINRNSHIVQEVVINKIN